MRLLAVTAVVSTGLASAYDVPENLQQIYNNHKV